jgi:ribose transport system permease protein
VIAIVIACGAAVGLINSFLVIELGINSIIATLAMMLSVEGVANVVSSGQLINLTDPRLTNIVNARPGGIPVPVIIMAVVYLAVYVFLTHTRPGWHLYATGASPTAAARSGIRVRALYRLVFLLSGALAAIAGVIYAGQGSTGSSGYGQTDTFLVITAVLLGGIGLGGGSGKIQRTLVGVLFIGVLTNGLILLNVQSFYQQLAQGLAFIAAVVLGGIKVKRGG